MNTFQLVYQDVRGGQGITLEAKDPPETLSLGSEPVVLTTLHHGSLIGGDPAVVRKFSHCPQ